MMAGAGMGQGVLGRYAPIKQMQGSTQQAMGTPPDSGQVPLDAAQGLRAQIQAQPKPAGSLIGRAMSVMRNKAPAQNTNSALQGLMARMRGMNPAPAGR